MCPMAIFPLKNSLRKSLGSPARVRSGTLGYGPGTEPHSHVWVRPGSIDNPVHGRDGLIQSDSKFAKSGGHVLPYEEILNSVPAPQDGGQGSSTGVANSQILGLHKELDRGTARYGKVRQGTTPLSQVWDPHGATGNNLRI